MLTQLDKKYKDRGLLVLAINAWDEPAELVQKYVESEKLTHRFLLKGHEVWRDRYHFFETPTTCWIDHKGRVINVHFGFDPGDEVALARRAEELLARGIGMLANRPQIFLEVLPSNEPACDRSRTKETAR